MQRSDWAKAVLARYVFDSFPQLSFFFSLFFTPLFHTKKGVFGARFANRRESCNQENAGFINMIYIIENWIEIKHNKSNRIESNRTDQSEEQDGVFAHRDRFACSRFKASKRRSGFEKKKVFFVSITTNNTECSLNSLNCSLSTRSCFVTRSSFGS